MNGRIQGRRIRIRRSPSVAASLLTELNPFLLNVTGQSGYELNGLSSGASNVCIGSWLRENSEIEFANGNFVSTSFNLKNKSAGDGCRDKTIEKTILRAFRARTFSRSQGQTEKNSMRAMFSGLLRIADI